MGVLMREWQIAVQVWGGMLKAAGLLAVGIVVVAIVVALMDWIDYEWLEEDWAEIMTETVAKWGAMAVVVFVLAVMLAPLRKAGE